MANMKFSSDIFRVYQSGRLTVVGFIGQELPAYDRVEQCRDELAELIKSNDCETLAFDLTGVPFIPSGILGLLVSLGQLGVDVRLYNPSEHVQDVLKTTKLDRRIHVQFVDM